MRVFKILLKAVLHLVMIVLLTAFTQVGGLIYVLVLLLGRMFKWKRWVAFTAFLGFYLMASLLIIPFLAPLWGRVPLPYSGPLRPRSIGTCLLNRHYAQPALKNKLLELAATMDKRHEGTPILYLDANFPFVNGFPLPPHLSHNDGRKIDFTFYYLKDKQAVNTTPSFLGYGVFAAPTNKEINYPQICAEKGYWQYNLLSLLSPGTDSDYTIDEKRTRDLIKLLATDDLTQKLFIEPHLKERWRLNRFDKIRFHGCQAVRHDDHIHWQIN